MTREFVVRLSPRKARRCLVFEVPYVFWALTLCQMNSWKIPSPYFFFFLCLLLLCFVETLQCTILFLGFSFCFLSFGNLSLKLLPTVSSFNFLILCIQLPSFSSTINYRRCPFSNASCQSPCRLLVKYRSLQLFLSLLFSALANVSGFCQRRLLWSFYSRSLLLVRRFCASFF